ncbi:regulator of nonsense transcripts UPF3-like isoform X3 [Mangifera indica]|uniref:regulator of nonsense transcripts UPF3-like isoform X3 n=1 Tax=Mangifera indica TaxID=29780 RepID=UPI001CFA7FB2|nr:regulator of nonsense transcripts UPF3-like isoform X3 [Mangifera indica]
MKERTKLVIRHLPPSLSQSDLLSLFHDRFVDRYKWFSFHPGKSSHKHQIQRFSRAYVELRTAEDVFEFADLLNGHVFVNEKGSQFKTIVEYAPSQRVPKPCTRKDSREGTIYNDPDYLEFLKHIAKPVENLPSAEIQLERKEAELSGAAKDTPIVTPLMEYVRQKRASKSGTQSSSAAGKASRRSRGASSRKSGSSTSKRGSEKKKYIPKGSEKNRSQKGKSSFIVVPKQEVLGLEGSVSGITLTSDSGKKKILLLKAKDPEISHQCETTSSGTTTITTKQIQRQESQTHPLVAIQPQEKQALNLENGKPLPRSMNKQSCTDGHVSNNDLRTSRSDRNMKRGPDSRFVRKILNGLDTASEKQEKHTRNRDRPDYFSRASHHHSDVSQTTEQCLSSLQPNELLSNSIEVPHGDTKDDIPLKSKTCGVIAPSNGGSRHSGRRVVARATKDDEGKSSKRRGAASSGAHEKQVWIQKSSSGH